jgi:two-component system, OmpR family, phosphate regulon sensor histidine kinase PhoR
MRQVIRIGVNQGDWQEHDFRRTVNFHAVLLAIAGHDLRQHLQVILNTYGWLSDHVTSYLERERIERGQRAVAQMADELQQLITALRIHHKTGRIDLVPVWLGPLFSDLSQEAGELALQRGVQLRVLPTRAVVASDPVLLKSVIGNLVRNAVKFTAPGGRVLLGCRCRGRSICIEVHDTGIGISSARLQKIFEAFYRIDATEMNGLGLGLFVVSRAIELLQHRIEVQSTVGRGSCFSILMNAWKGTVQPN